jgi:hypothetical protein
MPAKLSIVKPAPTGIKPSRKLGEHGASLWQSVMSEYQIQDSGGIELLTSACQQLDRAEALRQEIDISGEIIKTKTGPREHPGLKHELAARSFVVRTLHRLGLDVEAVRPVGRPPAKAWSG